MASSSVRITGLRDPPPSIVQTFFFAHEPPGAGSSSEDTQDRLSASEDGVQAAAAQGPITVRAAADNRCTCCLFESIAMDSPPRVLHVTYIRGASVCTVCPCELYGYRCVGRCVCVSHLLSALSPSPSLSLPRRYSLSASPSLARALAIALSLTLTVARFPPNLVPSFSLMRLAVPSPPPCV